LPIHKNAHVLYPNPQYGVTVVQPPKYPNYPTTPQLSIYPSSYSSVLHLLLRLRRGCASSRRTPSPALRRSLLRVHRHPSTLMHKARLFHYISTVLQWLCESAYRADDVFVAVDAEGDDWNEAEGKPRLTPDDACRIVALGFVSTARTVGEIRSVRNSDIGREPPHNPEAGRRILSLRR
jgi:hypothetical protein